MNIALSGNVLVATVDGEIDHSNIYSIRSKIDYEIKRNPIQLLIIDMTNLQFMDSSAIGFILGRYKLLKSLGGKVCLAKPNEQLMKIINMSGLHKILSIYNTVEEAMGERGDLVGKYN